MFIIGICGPSGSGKSTLARSLKKELNASILNLDNYFILPPTHHKYNDIGKDLELPQNSDWKKIIEVITSLQISHQAMGQVVKWDALKNFPKKINAKDVLIVEGFLLLHNKKLRDLLDFSVYLDVSDTLGLERRVKREKTDKDKEWFKTVTFPEYKKRRKLFEKRADLVLDATRSQKEIKQAVLSNVPKRFLLKQ